MYSCDDIRASLSSGSMQGIIPHALLRAAKAKSSSTNAAAKKIHALLSNLDDNSIRRITDEANRLMAEQLICSLSKLEYSDTDLYLDITHALDSMDTEERELLFLCFSYNNSELARLTGHARVTIAQHVKDSINSFLTKLEVGNGTQDDKITMLFQEGVEQCRGY